MILYVMFDVEQFINENETETLIRENEQKWIKHEENEKRLLILGLGSWYYKDQFLTEGGKYYVNPFANDNSVFVADGTKKLK